MKNTKTTVIATIITIMLIISCAYVTLAEAESADYGEFYPKLVVVVETEQLTTSMKMITCVDKDGNLWAFYDEEDEWEIGDIANLLMWNINEREEEHEIVEVYWEGYTEDIDLFLVVNGWAR